MTHEASSVQHITSIFFKFVELKRKQIWYVEGDSFPHLLYINQSKFIVISATWSSSSLYTDIQV